MCDTKNNWVGVAGSCECKSRYIPVNGVCQEAVICSNPMEIRDNTTNTCVCDAQKHYAGTAGSCTCDTDNNWVDDPDTELGCKCDEGYIQIDNSCQTPVVCSELGTIRDEITNSCVCDPEGHWVKDSEGYCVCDEDHLRVGEECQEKTQCTNTGSILDEETNTCVCDTESHWVKQEDETCACDEANGFHLIDGRCDTCGDNYFWNGHICKPDSVACNGTIENVRIGETIIFGHYMQDSSGETKPLEWIVLDSDEDAFLLVSKYVIDDKRYNEDEEDVNWDSSDMRKWLNSSDSDGFITLTFTTDEYNNCVHHVTNTTPNGFNATPGGPDTQDAVFLLSQEEAVEYFKEDTSRVAYATPYAKSRGVAVLTNACDENNNCACRWWLRTPGSSSRTVASVRNDGTIYTDGNDANESIDLGIRPAIWLLR